MKPKTFRYIVFTDASFKKYGNRGYCGYGVVVVNTASNCYTSFGGDLSDHTIVFGESWAILQGVRKVIDLINRSSNPSGEILVVTDSKLCVNILTQYINRWDTTNWDNWKTLKGKPVKNQEIYKRIVNLIEKYPDIRFRITHMHGHIGKDDQSKIKADLKSYGIKSSEETVKMFRKMNAKVDAIAQSAVDRQISLEATYGFIPIMKRSRKDEV